MIYIYIYHIMEDWKWINMELYPDGLICIPKKLAVLVDDYMMFLNRKLVATCCDSCEKQGLWWDDSGI